MYFRQIRDISIFVYGTPLFLQRHSMIIEYFGQFPELGFFNVRIDPNLARADLRDDSWVDPRNSSQDSSYSWVNSWTK